MSNELQKYSLNSPAKTLELASELTKFISERKLTSNIKGKEFVNVEGWQFAGAQLGVMPILTDLTDLSNEKEIKYKATVELRRLEDDRIVGRGVAICSNKEGQKRNFEEYAIASMAQTRAEGKAYRMLCSWLIKAAGYEPTPAEEADGYEKKEMPTEDEKDLLRKMVYDTTLTDDQKREAWATIEGCQDYTLYAKIQARLEQVKTPIDQIPNPSQKDINSHLRKVVK